MYEDYNEMVSVKEFCDMLAIGKNSAYKILASGKIEAFRLKRVWKIPKSAVIRYIQDMSRHV